MNKLILAFLFIITSLTIQAQTGSVRGNIYDKDTGEPIPFCNIIVKGTTLGTNTDLEGFYNITNIPEGNQVLVATYIGYDSIAMEVKINKGGIIYQSLYMDCLLYTSDAADE